MLYKINNKDRMIMSQDIKVIILSILIITGFIVVGEFEYRFQFENEQVRHESK